VAHHYKLKYCEEWSVNASETSQTTSRKYTEEALVLHFSALASWASSCREIETCKLKAAYPSGFQHQIKSYASEEFSECFK